MPAKPLIDPGVVSAPELVQDVNDIFEAIDDIDGRISTLFGWDRNAGAFFTSRTITAAGSSSLAKGGQNAPWLTSSVSNTGWLQVQGVLDGLDPGSAVVELYANRRSIPGGDPSGRGEGAVFLGAARTNEKGEFTAEFWPVQTGTLISATATDREGNTSEFSANIMVSGSL